MRLGKKFIITLVGIPSLCLLAGIIISVTYEDAVVKILKKYLDKHLTTEIEVSDIKFSVFRKFPYATVEFRNILAKSGVEFSSEQFKNTSTDTLLSAKSIFFEFSLPGILRGKYKLKNIQLVDGDLTLLVDKNGKSNFSIWENKGGGKSEPINFSLQNITFSNTKLMYQDLSTDLLLNISTKKLQVKADFNDHRNLFAAKGDVFLDEFNIGNTYEVHKEKLKVDLNLNNTGDLYKFSKSKLSSGNTNVYFQGEIVKSKYTSIILNFQCKNGNLTDIARFFQQPLNRFKNYYSFNGLVDVNGTLNGTLSKNNAPIITIDFLLKNGSLTNLTDKNRISNISLKGDYTNGSKKNASTSLLNIKEFNASQGNSSFNGAFKLKGFKQSYVELILKSDIDASRFLEFLNIDTLEQVAGNITTDIFIKGQLSTLKQLKKKDIASLYKEGWIEFNDVAFKLKGSGLLFNKVKGRMTLGDEVTVRNFYFRIFDNDFTVDCNMSNLSEFLFFHDFVYAEANLKSGHLDLKSLIENSRTDTFSKPLLFPKRIILKTNFDISNFIYGKFEAKNIVGTSTYNPKIFDFKTFKLETVEGSILGTATVSQDSENQIDIRCNSNFTKLNIQKLFFEMNNFGQEVILDKNLDGELSGTLEFSTVWDANLNLIDSSVLATSDIEIINGELLNYEPMLGLSKYINVDELKDIKFNTLKNQIFIKNRVITIPEMDISSTAFHIRGLGIHRFDNSYDYRIQVELSELLARKARKKRSDINEFGVEEDDGLGKLNIPIKITGKGSHYLVEFDRRKAIGSLKKNISEQKEELKNLFDTKKTDNHNQNLPNNQNKEFNIDWNEGNDKKDFIFEKKDQKKDNQPQFNIEWDDDYGVNKNDTISEQPN